MNATTKTFEAEVGEMLDLVVNSLYSKKEIFLRELISNASDAIDRAQYLGLTDKTLVADSPEWAISIVADKDAGTLSISDNGIGMTAEEAEKNLGTIARSGTQAFMESLKKDGGANSPEMIGQFGVGFYAAFMVADKVTVDTLHRGEGQSAVRWSSEGKGSYTIEDGDRAAPGTTITLHLVEDAKRFLDSWEIRSLVKQYSDFIAYPIRFRDANPPKDEKDDAKKRREEDEQKPVNTMRALWRRPKSEIKEDPAPQEEPKQENLQLYVRNVFIGSDFEELLPDYLRFVKGVVDSSDLPLNVSREMLQDDAVIRKMRSSLVSKILADLEALKKDDFPKYLDFFRSFGKVLKEGLQSDYEHADKLKELVVFPSDKTEDGKMTTLRAYKDAMPVGQKEIYYLVAESLENAKNSPQLEAFRKRGIDVLFLVDPVDEWIVDALYDYDGTKLRAIDKGEIELGTEEEQKAEKKELEEAGKEYKALIDYIKEKLKDDVKDVRLSPRLTDSACCLVAEEGAMNPTMIRMMKAMGQEVPKQLRTLELNPKHPILARLADELKSPTRDDEAFLAKIGALYDLALVGEGGQPRKPADFVKFVSGLL